MTRRNSINVCNIFIFGRVPSLSDALKLKLGNDIEEISHTLGGTVDFNDTLNDNVSPLPLSLPSSSSSSSSLGRKNNDFDIFYYEVSGEIS